MGATSVEMISWGMMLKKVPSLLMGLPRIIKGLKAYSISDANQPCGLGWTFEQAVLRNPQGLALLYENTQFTYDEVNRWANRIAHCLMARGIRKGDVVGIFVENRPELLVNVLAVSKIGAVCAMVNTSQTQEVLVHSFNLVKPAAVIVGEELVAAYNDVRAVLDITEGNTYFIADRNTYIDRGEAPAGYVNLPQIADGCLERNPESTGNIYFDDPCFYIYTSGTTGLPKSGIFKHGRWMKTYGGFGLIAMDMGPRDVMYSTLPLYHATGLCVCWGAAVAGASGFAIRRKFSATRFWDDVRKYNATAIGYVGELCRYLLEQPARDDDYDNTVVKMVGNGLRPGVWKSFKCRFGIDRVCELYAASDGNIGFTNILNFNDTVGFSFATWALVEYDKEMEAPTRGTNGFMRKVGKGGQGLLLAKIDAKSPLDGYTDPEKTRKVIFEDVFEKGDRYFNTGDILRSIGFGHVQFVDRLGDTFRWKGENVSTTEVENLMGQHPLVSEVVAYGVEVPNTNGRAGMAAITPVGPITAQELKDLLDFAKSKLPLYAVPLFLRLKAQMETTGTFKYQKKNLKDEGFDPRKTGSEPVYAWLPGTNAYVQVTEEVMNDINAGKFRY